MMTDKTEKRAVEFSECPKCRKHSYYHSKEFYAWRYYSYTASDTRTNRSSTALPISWTMALSRKIWYISAQVLAFHPFIRNFVKETTYTGDEAIIMYIMKVTKT